MTINSKATLNAAEAVRQELRHFKSGARTGQVAQTWVSTFDVAGSSIGTLAGTSTTQGVVPDDTTPGCLTMQSFNGNQGALDYVLFGLSLAGRLRLCDLLFKAGAYNFNDTNVTLSAQPQYTSRLPNSDYKEAQLWVETVTAFTGIPTFTIVYKNENGVSGRSTTYTPATAPTLGRLLYIPLASGDQGIQQVESVSCSVATVGTFNVLVLRPLWVGRVPLAGMTQTHGPDKTGLVRVYETSALYLMSCMDGGNTGLPSIQFGVVSG